MKVLAVQYKANAGNLKTRQDILEKLRDINPAIVKGLDAETSSYDDLTKSIDSYLLKLKEKIKAKLQEAELTALIEDEIKLDQQRAEAMLEVDEAQKKYNDTLEKKNKIEASGGDATALSIVLEGGRTRALESSKEALSEVEAQLKDNIEAQNLIGKKYEETTKSATELTVVEESLADAKKKHREENEKLIAAEVAYQAKLADLLGFFARLEKKEQERIDRMKEIQDMDFSLDNISMPFDDVIEPDIDFTKAEMRILNFRKLTDSLGEGWINFANGVGQSLALAIDPLSDIFADIILGADDAKEKFRELGAALLKQLISMAIGNLITSALSPLSPDNLATGGVAGVAKAGAAPALVAGLFGSIPAFAEGGAVLGPTLALVGEKAGSAGEAIIPFEKMTEFARKAIDTNAIGGGQNVTVSGRISGSDIVISNSRGSRSRSRF